MAPYPACPFGIITPEQEQQPSSLRETLFSFSPLWPSVCSTGKWDNEAPTSKGNASHPRGWNPTQLPWQQQSLKSRGASPHYSILPWPRVPAGSDTYPQTGGG